MTVVWSRSKARAISASDSEVSSRARYMASWRGRATRGDRDGESSCSRVQAAGGADGVLDRVERRRLGGRERVAVVDAAEGPVDDGCAQRLAVQ